MASELYIEGVKVDLGDDTEIALTKQANDVTKPDKIQADFSNPFTLPPTENNRAIFQFPDEFGSATNKPYLRLDAQYLQRGVEIVPFGLAQINQVDSRSGNLQIQVFSGNMDLFDKLGDKSIRELDLSAFDHYYNSLTVGLNKANTYVNGFVYDLIYRGKEDADSKPIAEDHYPSVFLKVVFDRIFQEAGFAYHWPDMPTAFFNRLLLPFVNQEPMHDLDGAWVAARTSKAVLTADTNYAATLAVVVFDNDSVAPGSDGSANNYNPVTGKYEASEIRIVDVDINIKLTADVANGSGDVLLQLVRQSSLVPGTPVLIDQVSVIAGETKIWKITRKDLQMLPGDTFFLQTDIFAPPNNFTIRAGSSWTVTPHNVVMFDTIFGNTWAIAPNLPEMKQKDVVKFVITFFQLICQTDPYTATINLSGFNKLLDNISSGNYLDMSSKIVPNAQDSSTKFRFGTFGQKSWVKWKTDEGVTEGYGNGFLAVADATLQQEVDIVTYPFAATEEVNDIPVVATFKARTGPEEEAPVPYDPAVTYQPGKLISYQGKRFSKITEAAAGTAPGNGDNWLFKPLEWTKAKTTPRLLVREDPSTQDLDQQPVSSFSPDLDIQASIIPTYFQTLTDVLNKTRLRTDRFVLDEADVASLDHTVPWWIDQHQAFFYVNKISQYQNPETPCLVELLKL